MSTIYCYYHFNSKAVGSCERCNRQLCSDCIYTFKNKILHTNNPKIKETYDEEEYTEALYYKDNYIKEKRPTEKLHWCYPCYYDHFNPKIIKQQHFAHELLASFVYCVIFSPVIILLLALLSLESQASSKIPGEGSSKIPGEVYPFLFVLFFILFFITFFIVEKRRVLLKVTEFNVFKKNFFNLIPQNISFPIECFYCKEKIRPDSFTCLNINCTLGEQLDQNAQIVKIEPVKHNLGLIDSLNELPKDPTTSEKHQKEKDPWE